MKKKLISNNVKIVLGFIIALIIILHLLEQLKLSDGDLFLIT
ncbi:hypothetical protein [Winogradskyella luteola]|nr:hypothetical protein [Winogradskyella luteola]